MHIYSKYTILQLHAVLSKRPFTLQRDMLCVVWVKS